MKDGPDISITAAMMGDPARANMLMALMSGLALTAAELAREAGVSPSTASGHLAKLEAAGLVAGSKQGRHRYFRMAALDVAEAIEALVTVAARAGHLRTRPGPKDPEMRRARSCYDHLAGALAVDLFERWSAAGVLRCSREISGARVEVTAKGREFLADRGIDLAGLGKGRRPLCRSCLDWSERRSHLGGSVGAAVLEQVLERGWASRQGRSRVIRFNTQGEQRFIAWYGSALPGTNSA